VIVLQSLSLSFSSLPDPVSNVMLDFLYSLILRSDLDLGAVEIAQSSRSAREGRSSADLPNVGEAGNDLIGGAGKAANALSNESLCLIASAFS
jgi:hypothetical protein